MWRYLFTSKYFRYGLLLTLAGALGIALFGVFRVAAFSYYGPITLPYTTPISDISAILFFGGWPVCEIIALHKWIQGDLDKEWKEARKPETASAPKPAPATIPTQVVEPIVQATPVAQPTPIIVATPAVAELVFVDEQAILKFGDAVSQLPIDQKEHLLCRAMFKHPTNKTVDWTIPYEEMTGNELNKISHPIEYWQAWHFMYDAVKSLDLRVKQELGVEFLMRWSNNTIKRTR